MEQQREIGGESVRKRFSLNEDRICELPDALLLEILSQLPTENVVATSALCKRWRSLWKMVPKLKFDSNRHKGEHYRFSEIVVRSLISHKAPVLESLHLVVTESEPKSEALDVGIWIGIAIAHNHVRELVVDLHICHNGCRVPTRIPSVLWSCNNNLETLKLDGSILLEFPSRVCFKSLRKLYLVHVSFDDEESVSNLFSGCTSLEDLVVKRLDNLDPSTFTIAMPSLQRLTIETLYQADVKGCYVINVPSLKNLSIKGINLIEFFLLENLPELVEATLTDVSDIEDENIFVSLTSVTRLSLNLYSPEIKYPTGIIFHQLVSLELYIPEGRNLLPIMLFSSPKLQILKFIDTYRWNKADHHERWDWSQPKSVPECLLFHLETFAWTGYEWQREDEKEVATYILKNAIRLKNTTLSMKRIESKDPGKILLKKREMLLNELVSVAGPSNSCHFVFK